MIDFFFFEKRKENKNLLNKTSKLLIASESIAIVDVWQWVSKPKWISKKEAEKTIDHLH